MSTLRTTAVSALSVLLLATTVYFATAPRALLATTAVSLRQVVVTKAAGSANPAQADLS